MAALSIQMNDDDDGDGVNAYQADGTTPLDRDDTDVIVGKYD